MGAGRLIEHSLCYSILPPTVFKALNAMQSITVAALLCFLFILPALAAPLASDVAIFVMTARSHATQRRAIRETWAQGHSNVYFVVGNKACGVPPSYRTTPWSCEAKIKVRAKDQDRYKEKITDEDAVLEAEAKRHGDLLILPFMDFYRSLPRKLKETYRWALSNTKSRWIVKIDDDAVARVTALENMLKNHKPNYSVVMGHIRLRSGVPRSGKWAELNFSQNVYPPFANGAQGHAVTRDVAQTVVDHNGFEYQGEDVSLGIWMKEAQKQVNYIHAPQYFTAHGNCMDKSKLVIGHNISPARMRACFPPAKIPRPTNSIDSALVIEQVSPQSLQLDIRFDIVIKTVYAAFVLSAQTVPRFVTDMYKRHLEVWNHFQEFCTFRGDKDWFDSQRPCVKKTSAKDFIHSFHATIESVRKKGFDTNISLVPITKTGFPLNGAHRVAAAIALGLSSMPIQRAEKQHTFDWSSTFFLKSGLETKYSDFAMLEWALRVPTTTVIVWPRATAMKQKMVYTKLLVSNEIGRTLYIKTISVTRRGLASLVYHAYGEQPWLAAKVSDLLGSELRPGQITIQVMFVLTPGMKDNTATKQKIRTHYGIQKSSVHISDNHAESMIIAEAVLNANSVQFLNRHTGTHCSVVANELAKRLNLNSPLPSLHLLPQTIMVDSGGVMSFFGLRPRTDVDILFWSDVNHALLGMRNNISVEPHTFSTTNRSTAAWRWGKRDWGEEHFGEKCQNADDLFYDPANYGYCHGVKYVSLSQLVRYKARRGEEGKDDRDVRLIRGFLNRKVDGLREPPTGHGVEKSASPAIKIEHGTGHYKLDKPTGKVPGTYSWSQAGQDKIVDGILNGRRNGFFIEIGGYDGELHSNSLFFEQRRGWGGLLVEANPYVYRQMVARDRKCAMANACISRELPSMDFKIGGGLTAAVKVSSVAHLRRIDRDAKVYGTNTQWEGYGNVVTTNCTTLDNLLQGIGVEHVDYFSLDVEGAEMFVLESIDWSKISVDVFTIETQENRAEIIKFMINHGYRHLDPSPLPFDDVFTPTDAPIPSIGHRRSLSMLDLQSRPLKSATHTQPFKQDIYICPTWFPQYAYLAAGLFNVPHISKLKQRITEAKPNDVLVRGDGVCTATFPGTTIVFNGEPFTSLPPRRDRTFYLGPFPKTSRTMHVYNVARWYTFLRGTHPEYFDEAKIPRRLSNSGSHFMIYIAKNCVSFRDTAYKRIKSYTKQVAHLGGICPNKETGVRVVVPNRDKRDENPHFFSQYRFVLCMENTRQTGYVTEKILNALISGAIPIYYGAADVFKIFNKDAIIYYDIDNPQQALDRIIYLESNRTAYAEVTSQPILANGERTLEKYFSLSDDVGGGKLKKRIRDMH